jgi:hypothetical protein
LEESAGEAQPAAWLRTDAYTEAWLVGAAGNREKFANAAGPLARRVLADSQNGQQVLRAIATSLLHKYRNGSPEERARRAGLAAINPLVIVLATGGNDERDLGLEIAGTYWASYAASFSGNKPGILLPKLVRQHQIAEALRHQEAIRIAIGVMDETEEAQQLDLRMKRMSLGQLTVSQLCPAVLKVLANANADRVIAFSPLNLDFIPFDTSILGLERPLVRFPVSTDIVGNFWLVNAAAISATLSEGSSSVAILVPTGCATAVEAWAAGVGDQIRELAPLWGFAANTVQPTSTEQEILELIQSAELVFFVGHSTAGYGVAPGALDLGHLELTFARLQELEWTGKLAFFFGCETGAIDVPESDLAGMLLSRGARAVLGTTAEISPHIVNAFLGSFLSDASSGVPLDYAFFAARRETVIAEALLHEGMDWDAASVRAHEVTRARLGYTPFTALLADVGMSWEDVYARAVFSLSITMAGGAATRLR